MTMILPIQITFRHFPHSDAVEGAVRERAAKLDRYHPHIVSCRVALELIHHHRARNNIYLVRIDVKVPGEEIVVGHEPTDYGHGHEDIYTAIKHAFEVMKRRLQDAARLQRGDVKQHEGSPHGRVVRLFPNESYGFIATDDGREIYFHANSVLNEGWNRIEVGNEVRFAEEMGESGPQASTVTIVSSEQRREVA